MPQRRSTPINCWESKLFPRRERKPLCGFLLSLWAAERQDVIRGGARGSGRLKYRALIVLEDLKILRDILRVIRSRVVCNSECRAKECGRELRDQFLERIGSIGEAFALFAIEPALSARIMGQLMKDGRIKGFLRSARLGSEKGSFVGDADAVG